MKKIKKQGRAGILSYGILAVFSLIVDRKSVV